MRAVLQAVAGAALVFTALGCKPEIGDDCDIDADCSNAGDRLCDRTAPGGYCTVFNCEPGTCPDEAVCIGFRSTTSALPADDGTAAGWACFDPQVSSRLERAFCMRRCKSNGDCRTGYECLDMGRVGNPHGAVVVEPTGTSGKVCAVPSAAEPLEYDGIPGVCSGDPGGPAGGASSDLAPTTGGWSAGGSSPGGASVAGSTAAGANAGGSTAGATAGGSSGASSGPVAGVGGDSRAGASAR